MYKKVGLIFEDATNSTIAGYYSLITAMVNNADLIIMAKKSSLDSPLNIKYKHRIEKFILECEEKNINIKTVHYEQLTLKNIELFVRNEATDIVFLPLGFNTIKNSRKLKIFMDQIKNFTDTKFAIVKAVHIAKIRHSKILLVLSEKLSHLNDWSDFIFSLGELSSYKFTLMYLTNKMDGVLPDALSKLLNLLESKKIYFETLILKGISGKKINLEAALRKFDLIVMGISMRSSLKSIFFGNLMYDVLKESPCNVIVFKV